MLASIIYAIGGAIETLIALRIVFRLIGANAGNVIVAWVYSWSTPLVVPFSGILGQDATVVSGIGPVTNSVFDWTALVALIVIGVVVGFVGSILSHRRAVA